MIEKEPSKNPHSPRLWLELADEDYVITRLLIHHDMGRIAIYHMQQAVEKYLKSFILTRCQLRQETKKSRVKYYINSSNIEFETHKLIEHLECCHKRHGFFTIPSNFEFIVSLNGYDAIRYPSRLIREDRKIVLNCIDKFAYNIRYIINIKTETGLEMKDDLISRLQRGDFTSWDMKPRKDLETAFFIDNKYFKKYQ